MYSHTPVDRRYYDDIPSSYYVASWWPVQQTLPGFEDTGNDVAPEETSAAEESQTFPVNWKRSLFFGALFVVEFIGTSIAYTLGTLMLAAPIIQLLIELGILK